MSDLQETVWIYWSRKWRVRVSMLKVWKRGHFGPKIWMRLVWGAFVKNLSYYQMLAREGIFRILITTKNFRALCILLASFSTILFKVWIVLFSSQVMEKLVDIVQFLHLEIHNTFGRAGIIFMNPTYFRSTVWTTFDR